LPITLKLNIYHFEPPKFGRPPKQFAKNAEKCAIDSFSKLKMIPQKLDNFPELFGHNKSGGLWLSATVWPRATPAIFGSLWRAPN